MPAEQIETLDPFSMLPDAFDDPLMRQWLCACAVFPDLRLPLTLQLGREVADFLDLEWPGENEFMHLARLAWFRDGRIPEDVRLALLESLDRKLESKVRLAIEEVIYNAVAELEHTSNLREFTKPKSSWRWAFKGFLHSLKPGMRQYDTIYRRFMLGYRPDKLNLEIEAWARRRLGDRYSPLVDLRSLTVGTASVVLALGLAFLPDNIGPLEKQIVSSERTAELVEFTDTLSNGSLCPFCPRMVSLPSASFVMGSPVEETERFDSTKQQIQVDLPAFAIGMFEVTVGQYRAFVDATGFEVRDGCTIKNTGAQGARDEPGRSWLAPGFEQNDSHPVTCVSWSDAQAFGSWLSEKTGKSYRLPSEAEWEFASRAGTLDRYFWGDDEVGCEFANGADESAKTKSPNLSVMSCSDGYYTTAPVGLFSPNAFGLYDMIGNVSEWMKESWHDSYGDAQGDSVPLSIGSEPHRVVRGGSWNDSPDLLRSATRIRNLQEFRSNDLGFRLARTLSP